MAPRPDKYVGLDLIWLDTKTFIGARLESWDVLGQYKCIGYDTSDKAIRIETKVEVDVRGWGT